MEQHGDPKINNTYLDRERIVSLQISQYDPFKEIKRVFNHAARSLQTEQHGDPKINNTYLDRERIVSL